ncbi:hypothetical protein [Ilumatobacter sp.]|uniref:hypothetical protein n=1 Tax=Ilumatobacter sp. TaxID=1967498 RepID=UPI003752FC96
MVVCDRRKRLTGDDRGDVALAIVQTCVLHLIRRTPSGSSVGLTGTRWPAISTRLHVPTLRGNRRVRSPLRRARGQRDHFMWCIDSGL